MTRKMTLLRLGFVVLVLGMLAGLPTVVKAATVYFRVVSEVVNVSIEKDGTMTVDYVIDIGNYEGGDMIYALDIRTPTPSYNLKGITASLNGRPITIITRSSQVKGINLFLGNDPIMRGMTDQVHITIPGIKGYLSRYNGEEGKVSYSFTPNYFESQFVTGETNLTVTLHLPPGVKYEDIANFKPAGWPGETIPQIGLDDQGRVASTWQTSNARPDGVYVFGGTFPDTAIPASAMMSNPFMTIDPGSLIGWAIGLVLVALVAWVSYRLIAAKKRKLKYLAPEIAIEANGIRRSLTAVEAAVLMEVGMDKILTMILFGLLKKGAATVTSRDPLSLKPSEPLPAGLCAYETRFLSAFKNQSDFNRQEALLDMMVKLIKSVWEEMRGFSWDETVTYYKDTLRQTWVSVEHASTPETKGQKYGEVIDWTLLDKDYANRTQSLFGQEPICAPVWWWRFDPLNSSPVPSTLSDQGIPGNDIQGLSWPNFNEGQPDQVTRPVLHGSDVAESVANQVTIFSSKVVGDIVTFTNTVNFYIHPPEETSNPISGEEIKSIDSHTTDPYKAEEGTVGAVIVDLLSVKAFENRGMGGSWSSGLGSSKGGGSSGGSGGHACACACAGCACACAGGR